MNRKTELKNGRFSIIKKKSDDQLSSPKQRTLLRDEISKPDVLYMTKKKKGNKNEYHH